jgi:type II secretory pathway pseudopilin PulG
MRAHRMATLLLLSAGCNKTGAGEAAGATGAARGLAYVPADALFVGGLNRLSDAKEMREGLRPLKAMLTLMDQKIPECLIDVYADLDTLVLGVRPKSPRSPVVIYAHGKDLRRGVEACAKTGFPGLTVTTEGKVSRYQVAGAKDQFALWLDGETVLAGPIDDRAATAALADVAHPIAKDGGAMEVVTQAKPVDSQVWAAAFLTWLPDAALEGGVPKPRWGAVYLDAKLAVHAILEMASGEDAEAMVAKLQSLMRAPPAPQLAEVFKKATVTTNGTRITASLDLSSVSANLGRGMGTGPGAAIATAGILAAVAIPAFMKNARKAKTTEATVNIKKMYDGAVAYYAENQAFPRSTEITPPLGSCCNASAHKCTPDPALWSAEGWQQLRFSMDDPHYYSYQYQSDGKTFSVDAYGDLNCNGVYSTFEMVGSITADGSVTPPVGLYKENELE